MPIRRGDGGEIVDEPTEPVRERGGSGDETTARDEATDSIARSGPASTAELKFRILQGIAEMNEAPVQLRWRNFDLDIA